MTGRKGGDQEKFPTNENIVSFQLLGQMALCHNEDNQNSLSGTTLCQIMFKL